MAAIEITLFVSKEEVQMLCGINIADDLYFTPACVMAHTDGLTNIVGKSFVDAISEDKTILSADLLYLIKMYLVFQTAVNFVTIASNKTSNFGVSAAADTYLQASENREIRTRAFYQGKADGYARKIQRNIICNINEYRQYLDCEAQIRANLKSYATSGIWLGGIRYVNG